MIGPKRSVVGNNAARLRGLSSARAAPSRSEAPSAGGSSGRTGLRPEDAKIDGRKRRAAKEFAWMSDDSDESASSRAPSRSANARCNTDEAETESVATVEQPIFLASASEVSSFSEMVRMAPELQRRVRRGSLPAQELAAVCTAAARVRFYDAELIAAVTSEVSRLLTRRSPSLAFGVAELVDVLAGLAQLNAYDRKLFSHAAAHLAAPGVSAGLSSAHRKMLLEAFQSTKHQGDEALINALAEQHRSERYEEAKDALWKRSLTRMYGETLDLRGSSEDAERALLKRRRPK